MAFSILRDRLLDLHKTVEKNFLVVSRCFHFPICSHPSDYARVTAARLQNPWLTEDVQQVLACSSRAVLEERLENTVLCSWKKYTTKKVYFGKKKK